MEGQSDRGTERSRDRETESRSAREPQRFKSLYLSISLSLHLSIFLSLYLLLKSHRLNGGVRPGFERGIIVSQNYSPVSRQFKARCNDGIDVIDTLDLIRDL